MSWWTCVVGASLLWATAAFGQTQLQRSGERIEARLANGVELSFALQGDELLGLQGARVDGVALKSDETVVRPVLIQEHGDTPQAWLRMRVTGVRSEGEKVYIDCALGRSDARPVWPRVFVMHGEKPHLDYYLFQHVLPPSEAAALPAVRALREIETQSGGTLTWVIEPVTLNIAGWPWKGWKHHYEFELEGGRVNVLRELATWELDGNAVGTTLVNMRYRGLGGIVCNVTALPGDPRAAAVAFTTTEIIPGAVGGLPAISPVVPGPQQIDGREDAMKHRHGAWIAQLQRGAGVNWVDYQYRPNAALATFYERMDAVRSLTEVFPGDRVISHTDCLYFPLTSKTSTLPKLHVALVADLPEHEHRTRWAEMDQYARDMLSADLGFVQHDPLPGIGINWDSGWNNNIGSLISNVESLKNAGAKRILVHHPGWFNGRGLRQKETPHPIPQSLQIDPKKPDEPAAMRNDTGGDCSIHDYVPQSPEVEQRWRDLSTALKAADMEYWVWICGMVYGSGPVVQQFGVDRFTRNAPDVDFSSGYPGKNGQSGHRGIAILDDEIRAWWMDRMTRAIKDLGVDGFWADSFQNMSMSQMNYQRDDWAPHVREWWEVIAQHTRDGAGWMGESQAFPGISCSIEVGGNPHDFDGVWWTMRYVSRWYRGSKVPHEGTPQADRLYFRSMANKGPIVPGVSHGGASGKALVNAIPRYTELSGQYMLALPSMQRSWQLPDDRGVLWMPNGSNAAGVLFSFVDQPLPEGVIAKPIGGDQAAGQLAEHQTYSVRAGDLVAAFGLRKGPLPDPR